VKRATEELTKIATDSSDSKIYSQAHPSAVEEISHSDLKRVVLKILANRDIMDVSTL
jgi:hypothetical protein